MVTHQLQVERRTGKVRRPETDVLPLCHATNLLTIEGSAKTESIKQGCCGYADPHGYGMGDDLPSPQTHGDSMGIFNLPEITR